VTRLIHILSIILFLTGAAGLQGATPAESKAFGVGVKLFEDKFYSTAEKTFAEFLEKNPGSDLCAESILFQSRARFFQTNYTGTLELLQPNLPQAGKSIEHYLFWLGEAHYALNDFSKAAGQYEELLSRFPDSARAIHAAVAQAFCFSRMAKWEKVIRLLQEPSSVFQKHLAKSPSGESSVQGILLLAEALTEKERVSEAEAVLNQIPVGQLSPVWKWKLQFLMARIQLINGRTDLALTNAVQLLLLSTNTAQKLLIAQSLNLQGEIYETLNTNAPAVLAYERLLTLDSAPVNLRQKALFKIVELSRRQKTNDVTRKLEAFVEQNPEDPTADYGRVALSELYLADYFNHDPEKSAARTNNTRTLNLTNLLVMASSNLQKTLRTPDQELKGRVLLDLGWCAWALDRNDEARTNFTEALGLLQDANLLCIAEFKLGDIAYKNQQHSEASRHYYNAYFSYYKKPNMDQAVLELGLYQCLRASLDGGDLVTASNVVTELFRAYPNGFLGYSGALLLGQDLTRNARPAAARSLFLELKNRMPDSPLLPEVDFAIARTFSQERDWTGAISQYELWANRYSGHPLAVNAEFSRALSFGQNGQGTNALQIMTNLAAKFPTNPIIPMAQQWIADYYFNREEYFDAEKNYQLVFQNPSAPASLGYLARLNAGKAAFALQEVNTARSYLTNLVTLMIRDTNAAPNLVAEGWLALGDTIYHQFLENTNKPLEELREAITAFSKITNDHTGSLAPQAYGKVGDCYFQWAVLKNDTSRFERATNAYAAIFQLPQADDSARHQAGCGIGLVFEAQGRVEEALTAYLKVLYEMDTSKPDSFWAKEAGLAAARLCELSENWDRAVAVYQRMAKLLPAYSETLDKKIITARTQVEIRRPASRIQEK